MSRASALRATAPHRGQTQLRGAPGALAASDLIAFAEDLVREAVARDGGRVGRVLAISAHLLAPGRSVRVTGEAACLSAGPAPVWRAVLSDDAGAALAEVVLTVALADAAPRAPDPVAPADASPEGRRERIARAAVEVIAEKGYAAASMREIAAAAGMHVPTMYQYVRSKEEILELVYASTIGQMLSAMEPVLAATGPVPQRLDAIIARLLEANARLRRETGVLNRETRSLSLAARDRVLGRYKGMVNRIGAVLAEGQDAGVVRGFDPQLAAQFIDALADVWPLRPFAVGHYDFDTYSGELAGFIRAALLVPVQAPGNPAAKSRPTETR